MDRATLTVVFAETKVHGLRTVFAAGDTAGYRPRKRPALGCSAEICDTPARLAERQTTLASLGENPHDGVVICFRLRQLLLDVDRFSYHGTPRYLRLPGGDASP